MSDLHVYYNDCDYVAAKSAEDAGNVLSEHTGSPIQTIDPEDWQRLPDDKVIRASDTSDDPADFTKKTCAEWAAGGRRYLFSATT